MYNLCSTLIIWLWGRAFGIGQHHDGITGTHTQAVQEDYVSKVSPLNFQLTWAYRLQSFEISDDSRDGARISID